MRRSKLLAPGGFSTVSAFRLPLDPYLPCAFCHRLADGAGWIHVASQRAICRFCLEDPHRHEGEAGELAAARLERLAEIERQEHERVEIY